MNKLFIQSFYRHLVFVLSFEAHTYVYPLGIRLDEGHIASAGNPFFVLKMADGATGLQISLTKINWRQNVEVMVHNTLGYEVPRDEVVTEFGEVGVLPSRKGFDLLFSSYLISAHLTGTENVVDLSGCKGYSISVFVNAGTSFWEQMRNIYANSFRSPTFVIE